MGSTYLILPQPAPVAKAFGDPSSAARRCRRASIGSPVPRGGDRWFASCAGVVARHGSVHARRPASVVTQDGQQDQHAQGNDRQHHGGAGDRWGGYAHGGRVVGKGGGHRWGQWWCLRLVPLRSPVAGFPPPGGPPDLGGGSRIRWCVSAEASDCPGGRWGGIVAFLSVSALVVLVRLSADFSSTPGDGSKNRDPKWFRGAGVRLFLLLFSFAPNRP